jgi:hypothetical protein
LDQLIDALKLGLPERNYFMGGTSGGPLATVTDNSGILAQLSQIGGSQTAKSFVFNKRMLKVSTTF